MSLIKSLFEALGTLFLVVAGIILFLFLVGMISRIATRAALSVWSEHKKEEKNEQKEKRT